MYFAFVKFLLFFLFFLKQHFDDPIFCFNGQPGPAEPKVVAAASQCYGIEDYAFLIYNETEIATRHRGQQISQKNANATEKEYYRVPEKYQYVTTVLFICFALSAVTEMQPWLSSDSVNLFGYAAPFVKGGTLCAEVWLCLGLIGKEYLFWGYNLIKSLVFSADIFSIGRKVFSTHIFCYPWFVIKIKIVDDKSLTPLDLFGIIKEKSTKFCLEKRRGKPELRRSHNYYFQI